MITFVPKAGLGNRMRGIASAYRLAKSINEQLNILWIDNHECNCSIYELFDLPKEIGIKHIPWIPVPLSARMHLQNGIRKYYQSRNEIVLLDEDLWDMEATFIRGLKGHRVYIESAAGWDCEEENSFDIFRISERIITNVDSYIQKNGLMHGQMVGVHIRRTDMDGAKEKSPREAFESVIEREIQNNSSVQIYLASDDKSEKEYFVNRFGKNRIFTQNKNMNREKPEGIEFALMEVVLLSRCDRIYGTKGSSFSNLASALGKKPFMVVTREMELQ